MSEKVSGPYNSVNEMFSEMHIKEAKFKKDYPTLWMLKEVYWWFYRLWHNHIRLVPREIKWFYQRGKRGWADCDIWGFDCYISRIIYTGLEKLRKIQHILPDWKEGMTEEEAQKSWDIKITEMIWAFKAWHNCCNGDWEFYVPGRDKEFELLHRRKYPETYFMSEEDHARMIAGMKLMIDNFGSLWD